MATRTGRGATAAAATLACCSSTERTHAPFFSRRAPTLVSCAQAQSLDQPAPQLRSVIVTLQCKVNRSLEVPAGISQVVSASAMHDDVDGMTLVDEQSDRIGQLDFASD